MGGSLRRTKKFRPKLTVKGKRKPLQKSKVAHDVTQGRVADIEAKVGKRPQWNKKKGYNANFKEAGLLSDINMGFGRNSTADALQEAAKEREASGNGPPELDEDFAATMHVQRPGGPTPLPRLTTHQRQIVERLIAAHGDDVEAMKRDSKLNSMLLPLSKLRKMLESYRTHGRNAGVDFRVPHKRLW